MNGLERMNDIRPVDGLLRCCVHDAIGGNVEGMTHSGEVP
jgi:hypothetical protein